MSRGPGRMNEGLTTLYSLAGTVAIAAAGVVLARALLPTSATSATRFLFVWHAADALCHTILEGSFLYHCFFTSVPISKLDPAVAAAYHPTPYNYLGTGSDRIFGVQAGGDNPFAQLWMVYARADKRWAGVDLGVVSLELLTVFVDTALAVGVCWCLARKNPMSNVLMIILATCELYGGFMTFCPEWLTGNINLDTSNFMYKWVYLVFFNVLWVFIPLYAIYYAVGEISSAFKTQSAKAKQR
ncbi:unnamed protein product [Parascedosporium putredinis]|uniref:EXPERA domain-containing protein n=1 Tax=Parascedosporium putredinis TaxID=1442378 RepID=A0A9P1M6G1_9PEZI|nr:unnamed protein product [Parascedosporium putredinis]CAI7987312.1 unnamed protein product [Parascedosporium putredinis]